MPAVATAASGTGAVPVAGRAHCGEALCHRDQMFNARRREEVDGHPDKSAELNQLGQRIQIRTLNPDLFLDEGLHVGVVRGGSNERCLDQSKRPHRIGP